MKIGPLSVTLHRTVRVAEGRVPANLPPSLGHCEIHKVSDYAGKCPSTWETEGVFCALHDTEALWLSFHTPMPLALLIGAGGVNALTGEKLGTKLSKGNYLVTPPQPWLDGFKSTDGCVYQFVSARFEGGKGKTVAEQLIGEESKTGGIGIAVFESKEGRTLTQHTWPDEGFNFSPYEQDFTYKQMGGMKGMSLGAMNCVNEPTVSYCSAPSARKSFAEMGLGKGGKIRQKVYDDPHGLDVWRELPSATGAIYIVNAETFSEITGKPMTPKPKDQAEYQGAWFGLKDQESKDIEGSNKFTGLKSVFTADETMEANKSE